MTDKARCLTCGKASEAGELWMCLEPQDKKKLGRVPHYICYTCFTRMFNSIKDQIPAADAGILKATEILRRKIKAKVKR